MCAAAGARAGYVQAIRDIHRACIEVQQEGCLPSAEFIAQLAEQRGIDLEAFR
jgi:hypothetical protein